MEVKCPYCGRDAELVTGDDIYTTNAFNHLYFWMCGPCAAYVGTHAGKKHKPMGTLAKADLRVLRRKAHAVFDSTWRETNISRSKMCDRMSALMELPIGKCHIGMFNEEQCFKVIEYFGG